MSLERENYNDIGTPLDFQYQNHDRAATLIPDRKTDVKNTTLQQRFWSL